MLRSLHMGIHKLLPTREQVIGLQITHGQADWIKEGIVILPMLSNTHW